MLIKFAAILVIGPSPEAVVVFEVLLNATAMFNHGNVRSQLPLIAGCAGSSSPPTCTASTIRRGRRDQQQLRLQPAVVDRLFGTYRDQPRGGHAA